MCIIDCVSGKPTDFHMLTMVYLPDSTSLGITWDDIGHYARVYDLCHVCLFTRQSGSYGCSGLFKPYSPIFFWNYNPMFNHKKRVNQVIYHPRDG